MASYSTNELCNGLKVMLEGAPCIILEVEFVKPGKGQAFNRVKLRQLTTGRVWERTFKSGESIEAADVMESKMSFLYRDGQTWHFMESQNYEQYQATTAVVGKAAQWLAEQMECQVTLWNGEVISVTPPNFVELTVSETDPGVRGNTSSGGSKPATLSTGAVVKVPLFIEEGDVIRLDTRTATYQGRSGQT